MAVRRAEALKRSTPQPANRKSTLRRTEPEVASVTNVERQQLSGQSRRRSKSRERGQRLSDTRLESRRKRKAVLSRSKSDSCEHLNKLSNLKSNYSSSTDTDDERPTSAPLRSRRVAKSVSKEKLAPSVERPKSVDYSRLLEQVHERSVEAGDDVINSVGNRARRKSWTVKNRDWHKELADQYTGKLPTSSTSGEPQRSKTVANDVHSHHHTKPAFAYRNHSTVTSSAVEEERARSRRWEPPVHPTKDLILYDSDGNAIETTSSSDNLSPRGGATSGFPAAGAQRQVQTDFTPTHVRIAEEEKRRMSQGTSSSYRNSDSPPSSPSEHDDSDIDFERSGGALSWSVSKLKSLYDNSKEAVSGQSRPVPKPRATAQTQATKASNVPNWRPKNCVIITKEKTNPNAEQQYL